MDNLQEALIKILLEHIDYKEIKPQVEDNDRDKETIEYFKSQIKQDIHEPILINSELEVLDGNHRLTAYQELNIEPPLLYQGERKDFYSVANEANYDGIAMIKIMIQNGTAKKI